MTLVGRQGFRLLAVLRRQHLPQYPPASILHSRMSLLNTTSLVLRQWLPRNPWNVGVSRWYATSDTKSADIVEVRWPFAAARPRVVLTLRPHRVRRKSNSSTISTNTLLNTCHSSTGPNDPSSKNSGASPMTRDGRKPKGSSREQS